MLKSQSNPVVEGWKNKHTLFLLCTYILLVLFATLFPFNLISEKTVTLEGVVHAVEWDLISRSALKDFPRNIVLFVPFGFAFAYHARRWGLADVFAGALTLVTGTILSFTIEILQQFIPLRFSAIADTAANSLGTLIGWAVFLLIGKQAAAAAAGWIATIGQRLTTMKLFFVTTLYSALVFSSVGLLQSASTLTPWDTTYPITLRNEPTGDRPWQGRVDKVYLTSKAFDENQVARTFAVGLPETVVENSLTGYYQIPGDAQHSDRLIDEIRRTSQFTLSLIAASISETQTGPGRILAISNDHRHANFIIGQEGKDLVIRMRNGVTGKDGRHPEMIVPGVWADTALRHIIFTYDGSIARVFVDSIQWQYAFEFTPEVALFWSLSLADSASIRFGSNHQWIVKVIFYGLVFIPFGWLLLLWQKIIPGKLILKLIFIVPGICLPAALLQAVLNSVQRGYADRWGDFLLSVFFSLLAMLLFQDFGQPITAQNIKDRAGESISSI